MTAPYVHYGKPMTMVALPDQLIPANMYQRMLENWGTIPFVRDKNNHLYIIMVYQPAGVGTFDAKARIYKSTDNGQSWTNIKEFAHVRTENTSVSGLSESLVFVGDRLYAFLQGYEGGAYRFYWAWSNDFGATWSATQQMVVIGDSTMATVDDDGWIHIWHNGTGTQYHTVYTPDGAFSYSYSCAQTFLASRSQWIVFPDGIKGLVGFGGPGNTNRIWWRRTTKKRPTSTADWLPRVDVYTHTAYLGFVRADCEGDNIFLTWANFTPRTIEAFYSPDRGTTWINRGTVLTRAELEPVSLNVNAVHAVFALHGILYLFYLRGSFVMLKTSMDWGLTWSTPMQITANDFHTGIDWAGTIFPGIALGPRPKFGIGRYRMIDIMFCYDRIPPATPLRPRGYWGTFDFIGRTMR